MHSPPKPRICISVCERTVGTLERAIATAAGLCELIEVRLDCLEPAELETGPALITKLLEKSACESILTFRPEEQGGQHQLSDETRHAFWSSAIFSRSFFDVELDLAESFNSTSSLPLPIDWSRTICSQHDFAGMPRNLDLIYERMAVTPARVLKIAVLAHDATDCIPIFHLLERARQEGREMIAIAMGTAGIATRVLGPSRGGFLTYAALENESVTAPGQISADELHEVYRIEKIDQQTQICGLVGLPVSHSVSTQIHNAAFEAAGVNAVYLPFEVRDIDAFMTRMIHPATRELNWNMRGLSITAPHKAGVMKHLDWIEPAAKEIGAVNTVMVAEEKLHGYNTDALGFLKPLRQKFGPLRGASCVVIGAGGAASAAVWGLRQEGAKVMICARGGHKEHKAEALAERFGVSWQVLEGATFQDADVVINATPLGTRGEFENLTPVSAEQLRGARLAYDLVYNPIETRFLREAREAGSETLGGLPMLVGQAAEQYKLWTGAAAPEGVMYAAGERALHG
jgi:3-dehydroquinate dehydratase/shikimate dehydrogenase